MLYPPGSCNAQHTVKLGHVKQEEKITFLITSHHSLPCKAIPFSATKTSRAAAPVNNACMCWPPQSVSCTSISCTLKQKHSPHTTALYIPVLKQTPKQTKTVWSCLSPSWTNMFSQQTWTGACSCAQRQACTQALVSSQAADGCICTG